MHKRSSLTALLTDTVQRFAGDIAIDKLSGPPVHYGELFEMIERAAAGLLANGLEKNERVAVYLNKSTEAIAAFFATNMAGGIFIPVNPVLKPGQVAHILNDSQTRMLVTSATRLESLRQELEGCEHLSQIVCIGNQADGSDPISGIEIVRWVDLLNNSPGKAFPGRIDKDIASIFYTSGSTGKPKGVVLSHRNMVDGAESVSGYLENTHADRILGVLPFSFDYGFSQITTAFMVGARILPLDYLLPRDVVRAVAKAQITGLAGVPPLWAQLSGLEWPDEAVGSLRYCTNSGGRMPKATLRKLRNSLPKTDFFLMYGLTEAFRSTYLPPAMVDQKPDSIGKAIPNAEVLVVNEHGKICQAGEPGELVHRGSLVAAGYWNDAAKTAERFRPPPKSIPEIVLDEIAVWSGDKVVSDEDGYLYFVGRDDEMIKSSGYRVSPTEVEEAVYESGLVSDVVVTSAPDAELGEIIIAAVTPAAGAGEDSQGLLAFLRKSLPAFMLPRNIYWSDQLPRNPNGKLDRPAIRATVLKRFHGDHKDES